MYKLLRPLLFALDEERTHDLTIASLAGFGRLPGAIRPGFGAGPAGEAGTFMGLRFANRLGLAAGLDKDARALEGLARLGFGFVEVGTVTPKPQPGNERPRLFRLTEQEAIVNRMGFNNDGVDAFCRRLEAVRQRGRLERTLVGVNVGKNKATPLERAADDYTLCMERVYALADYLTLNLSSPNTPGLRQLQSGAELERLLDAVSAARERLSDAHGVRRPLALKVAPDLHDDDVVAVAAAVRTFAIDAVIAGNTTITRPGLDAVPKAGEAGGLSGRPLHPLALEKVAAFRRALGPGVPLIGVGGILSAAGGSAMLEAGADLLQIYSGLIFRGPALVGELLHGRPA
jgi:dihydroorotate dehydrogenase